MSSAYFSPPPPTGRLYPLSLSRNHYFATPETFSPLNGQLFQLLPNQLGQPHVSSLCICHLGNKNGSKKWPSASLCGRCWIFLRHSLLSVFTVLFYCYYLKFVQYLISRVRPMDSLVIDLALDSQRCELAKTSLFQNIFIQTTMISTHIMFPNTLSIIFLWFILLFMVLFPSNLFYFFLFSISFLHHFGANCTKELHIHTQINEEMEVKERALLLILCTKCSQRRYRRPSESIF